MLEAYAWKSSLLLYVAYCTVIYTLATLYFYLTELNDLFKRYTSQCTWLYVVCQTQLPKIAIIDRPFFILKVLLGSYKYFWGPVKEFYEDFFFHWSRKNFTKLRLVIITRLQQQFVVWRCPPLHNESKGLMKYRSQIISSTEIPR